VRVKRREEGVKRKEDLSFNTSMTRRFSHCSFSNPLFSQPLRHHCPHLILVLSYRRPQNRWREKREAPFSDPGQFRSSLDSLEISKSVEIDTRKLIKEVG